VRQNIPSGFLRITADDKAGEYAEIDRDHDGERNRESKPCDPCSRACDLSIVLIAISYPPATTEPAACPEQEPLLAFPSGCGDEMAEAGDGENLSFSALRSFEQEDGYPSTNLRNF
jgi:hypothetical protein